MLAACEGLATALFSSYAHRLPFPDPAPYVATPEEVAAARRFFDRELGWTVRYDTPRGERPRQRDFGRPLVAAFGDSFTHGDGVGDRQTWCEQLALRVEADVFNYGVGAYGMDQALLRFERDFPHGRTPIALFAFITSDIDRNVSIYRKFHRPDGDFVLTKPRFVLAGDGIELVPNPIESADAIRKTMDEDFIREIGRLDHWYNPHDLPELGFPRLAALFRPALWRSLGRQRSSDLWANDGEARRISERILTRFHRRSRQWGARPLIVHFPVVGELLGFAAEGEVPPAVEFLSQLCRRREFECLAPIETARRLSRGQIAALFADGIAGGHYNAFGHAWVAEYLVRVLDGRIATRIGG